MPGGWFRGGFGCRGRFGGGSVAVAVDAVLDEEFRGGSLTLLAVDAEGDCSAWALTWNRLPFICSTGISECC